MGNFVVSLSQRFNQTEAIGKRIATSLKDVKNVGEKTGSQNLNLIPFFVSIFQKECRNDVLLVNPAQLSDSFHKLGSTVSVVVKVCDIKVPSNDGENLPALNPPWSDL